MSTQIGTNFDYRGKRFLDSRQGKAGSKEELRDWNFSKVPVPPGFEICLTLDKNETLDQSEEEQSSPITEWYYYDPDLELPDTGHWIPRLVGESEWNSMVSSSSDIILKSFGSRTVSADILFGMLKEHDDVLFPLSIGNIKASSYPSGKIFEVGEEVYVDPVTYTLKRGSKDIQNYSDSISPANEVRNEPGTWEHSISVSYEGKTVTGKATVVWRYKIYWGVIDGNNLPEGGSDYPTTNFEGSFTTTGKLSSTRFNCSGGRYPCIFIPVPLSVNNPRVIVGGLDNSDIEIVSPVNLVLGNGLSTEYQAIYLRTIQTGENIQIEVA